MLASWFGTIGALGTTFSFLPQVVKMHRSDHVDGVSPVMMIVHLLGVSNWIVYGCLRKDYIVVTANSISASLVLMMILMYGKKQKNGIPPLLKNTTLEI